ncbi:MAG: tetratricopeptide repeat protein [Alphaproteobacteria bacterium]
MRSAQAKFVQFTLAVLIAGLWPHARAVAEEVKVRTGAHAQYSRLVFDWTKPVEYKIERSESDKARLVVSFAAAASLDMQAATSNPVANIAAIEVLSADPLKLALKIPAQSRVRDLRAGNKIVIDVYHPPGGPEKRESLSVKTQEAVPAPQPETAKAPPAPQEVSQGPDAAVYPPVLEEAAKKKEEAAPELRKLEMREEPTLVTVSATQNFGMAVFEVNGNLWLVDDKADLLIKPQFSGPLSGELSFKEIKGPQGNAHILKMPQNKTLKGDGGGILWRVLIGPNFSLGKTPDLRRPDANRNDPRSGKILWPLKGARAVLGFKDPVSGNDIKVVTVESADQFAGPPREFIDFDILPSPVGLAVMPKTGDLELKIVRGGVEISRPHGLTVVEAKLLDSMTRKKIQNTDKKPRSTSARIFDFKAWQLGGVASLHENKRILLAGQKELPETAQSENLLTLAKMYLSNAMGPEALGVLELALQERPVLLDSPEFSALYGVASALSYHNEDAFAHLSRETLQRFEEIHYWRAYILADEGDWQQAAETLPENLATLHDYPALLQNRLLPKLVEIALRSGDLRSAEELLGIVGENEKSLSPPQQAALTYLQGEVARQKKDLEKTKALWEPLANGPDDLYRAKASLALTRLLVDDEEMNAKDAIDNLERLRYAWRGDELEVQINYWLGRTYFESGQHLKGLKLMRDAVSYDEGTPLGPRVAAEMADMYAELFLGEALNDVSPLEAVGLYDEFKELVPLDSRGDKIIEKLAEHLVKADLLTRAGDLLQYQIDHRLKDADIYRVATRLAAIRLLDNQPDKALKSLNTAGAQLEKLPEEMRTPKRYRDIVLLRARALSRKGRPDQALALLQDLERTPDMNRLRADIAWTAGYWDDAAEALGDVILDQNISLTRPLDDKNTALLLQRAVSLNLAGDRIELANMREKYTDLMTQTEKAKTFEVITRPRQSGALADRETLLSVVSEVDLFKDFLDSYKTTPQPIN